MKVEIILILLTAIALMAQSPTPYSITDDELQKISPDEIARTIAHRNALQNEALETNSRTQEAAKAQAQSLVDAAQSNQDSAKALAAYQKGVSAIVTQANIAISAHSQLVKQLHRAKYLACGLVIAVFGFIAMKVGGKIGLIIGGVGSVAVCSAVWIWL